jgi:hypothetical protein
MRVNQDLRPLHSFRNKTTSRVSVPAWLEAQLGQREREIIYHPQARFLQEDQEGSRHPNHQQWIGSLRLRGSRRGVASLIGARSPERARRRLTSSPRLR